MNGTFCHFNQVNEAASFSSPPAPAPPPPPSLLATHASHRTPPIAVAPPPNAIFRSRIWPESLCWWVVTDGIGDGHMRGELMMAEGILCTTGDQWWVLQDVGSTASGSGTVVSSGRALGPLPAPAWWFSERLCGAVSTALLSALTYVTVLVSFSFLFHDINVFLWT
jgi:hypothetical protein